jgi:hypothetical protein
MRKRVGDQLPVKARLVRANKMLVTQVLPQDVATPEFLYFSEEEEAPTDGSFTLYDGVVWPNHLANT